MRLRDRRLRSAVFLILTAVSCLFHVEPVIGADVRLRVLQGEGRTNRIKKDLTSQITVVAEDEKGSPLSGVVVVFQLPVVGAGGAFESEQSRSVFSVVTDASGQASTVFRPNERPGSFRIRVRAAGETSASVDILQTNKKTGVPGFVWALVAGGAAGGAFAARGGSGGGSSTVTNNPPGTSTQPSSTTITVGTGTFGRPQ